MYPCTILSSELGETQLCSEAAAAVKSGPIQVSLNDDWDFAYMPTIKWWDEGESTPILPENEAFESRMPVPGYWDDNTRRLQWSHAWRRAAFNPKYYRVEFPTSIDPRDIELLYLVGVGYYRKSIVVPPEWRDKTIALHIGGARMTAWAWVNGTPVGYHDLHTVPFEFVLTEHLKPGEVNELVIAVANNHKYYWTFGTTSGYPGRSAGIYRPVYLKVSGGARIADCYVRLINGNAGLSWSVEVDRGSASGSLSIEWSVRSKDGATILGRGNGDVSGAVNTWETESFAMVPWSDRDPNLYGIEVVLTDGDRVLDRVSQDFGLRTLARDGTRLLLNGTPVMLRGTCTHHTSCAPACMPPPDVESYRRMIRRKKALGFNWIRFHTAVPTEEYLQAADELGIMVQVEGSYDLPDDRWIEIIRTCRKHPSVVLYCCGNEEHMDEARIAYTRHISELCREHAPDALFQPMEALNGIDNPDGAAVDDWVKPYVKDPHAHNREMLMEMRPYYPEGLSLIKEFSDVLSPNSVISYALAPHKWGEMAEERYASYERPLLMHEVGIIGNYIDLDLEHRYEGTRIGPDLYAAARRYIEGAGLLDKAATYFNNSCAWQRIVRKHNLECARKCKYVAGYDFLGDVDQHGHRTHYPCGIMNEFYEMKPGESAGDVLKYNGESVLLLDYPPIRNLEAGKDYSFDVWCSLYGERPLESGRLNWYLSDDQRRVFCRGDEIAVRGVGNGCVERLGAVTLRAPQVRRPVKLTLHAHLSGGDYAVSNDWDFWVFPQSSGSAISPESAAASPPEALRVLSELGPEDVEFLAAGGGVLLLGHKPFPALPTCFSPSPTARTRGNVATVIAEHPLMNGFPHDGYCDWQFYSMLEGGSAVVFNDLDIPFDPIIDVISSFKYIRKQSSLFELQVGRGKLLVCGLNIDVSDPGAAYFLERMLAYALSDEFQPPTVVEPEHLVRRICPTRS